MALMACPECGENISDKAPTCPRCGAPILVESKLIVSAPSQAMLVSPKVRVEIDGREVALLRRGELADIPVERDGVATFWSSGRSATLRYSSGKITRVQLAWNRITGSLVAQEVEAITSGSALL